MITLDLSRVNRKAQGPEGVCVLLVPFDPTPSHTLKLNWKDPIGQPD